MSITTLFKSLRAPLVNSRWSWGASNDDYVVMRIWADQMDTLGGVKRALVFNPRDDIADKYGQHERQRHLVEIEDGKPCYLIKCNTDREDALTREIKSFDKNSLFVGGKLIKGDDGAAFIEITNRIKVMDFLRQQNIIESL